MAEKFDKSRATGFFVSYRQTILLEPLTTEEKGKLIEALINYGQFGVVTTFTERYMNYVYGLMKGNIDSYYKAKNVTFPEIEAEPEPTVSVEPPKQEPKPKPRETVIERPVEAPKMWLDVQDMPEPLDPELTFTLLDFRKAQ